MPTRTIGDAELEAILARNVQWLESKGTQGALVDLNHVDLRGRDLRGLPLYKADLSGADLRGADLSRATLIGANLRGSQLDRAVMRDADLRWADLTEAELRDVQLIGANLSDARLSGVAFGHAHLMDTRLVCADLRGCHALEGSNFINADLSQADLSGAHLCGALFADSKLVGAKLPGATLTGSNFERADLSGADLSDCDLVRGEFFQARLRSAVLDRANLSMANLYRTDFSLAKLRGAKLVGSRLIECDLTGADLSGASVYGIAAWEVQTLDAAQTGLLVTPPGTAAVTVDDLEIAQFVYLLLNRQKLRNLLDVITSKAVLILGRFTPERKRVLDGIAEELRRRDLLPIIFDFERSTSRDFTETIKTLAGLSMFVIVDITNPKSAPLELQATVPDYQIPFVTIIEEGQQPFSMFADLGKYDWVLQPVVTYRSLEVLRGAFQGAIVDRALGKRADLQRKKAQALATVSAEDFLLAGTPAPPAARP